MCGLVGSLLSIRQASRSAWCLVGMAWMDWMDWMAWDGGLVIHVYRACGLILDGMIHPCNFQGMWVPPALTLSLAWPKNLSPTKKCHSTIKYERQIRRG